MRIFIQFDNGARVSRDCSSIDEARGYVAGVAVAAEQCRLRVWVAVGQAGDRSTDNGQWQPPGDWLERYPSPLASGG